MNAKITSHRNNSTVSCFQQKETQLAQDSYNANVENDEKSDDANHELNDESEEENARERSDENNVSDSLLMRS